VKITPQFSDPIHRLVTDRKGIQPTSQLYAKVLCLDIMAQHAVTLEKKIY